MSMAHNGTFRLRKNNNTSASFGGCAVSIVVLGEPLQVTVRPMLRDRCPVCRVCISCLQRWYIVAKRLDTTRCHLVRR